MPWTKWIAFNLCNRQAIFFLACAAVRWLPCSFFSLPTTSNQMKPSRARFEWLNNILSAHTEFTLCVARRSFFPTCLRIGTFAIYHLRLGPSTNSMNAFLCCIAPGRCWYGKFKNTHSGKRWEHHHHHHPWHAHKERHRHTINNMQTHFPSSLHQSCSIEHSNVDKCVFPFLFCMCRWCITNAP